MKKYKVLSPVADSKDNHKYYEKGSTIKLDKERGDKLVEIGTIRELTDEEEAEEAAQAAQTVEESKEEKSESVTKEDKGKGNTKAK